MNNHLAELSLSKEELVGFETFASSLATKIGERLRDVALNREQHHIEYKGERDLLTEYDLWSEKQIVEAVNAAYPKHIVFGEESSNRLMSETGLSAEQILESGFTWIVDPIDGTTNFSCGIPHFGISIALAHKGRVIMGVVYEPCKRELFSATLGNGATLNGAQIKVSNKARLLESVVATGFPYTREELWHSLEGQFHQVLLHCRDIRRLGAASLDICYVACGRFDAYYEYTLNPWDIAAGHLIVSEAGGVSQNIHEALGTELTFPCPSYGCGSGESFKELLQYIDKGRNGQRTR